MHITGVLVLATMVFCEYPRMYFLFPITTASLYVNGTRVPPPFVSSRPTTPTMSLEGFLGHPCACQDTLETPEGNICFNLQESIATALLPCLDSPTYPSACDNVTSQRKTVHFGHRTPAVRPACSKQASLFSSCGEPISISAICLFRPINAAS